MSMLKTDLEFLSDCATKLSSNFNATFNDGFSLLLVRKGYSYKKYTIKRPVPYSADGSDLLGVLKGDLIDQLKDHGWSVIDHNVKSLNGSTKHLAMLVHDAKDEKGVVGHVTFNRTPISVHVNVGGQDGFVDLIQSWYDEDERKTPSLKRLKYVESQKRIITDIIPLPDYTSLNKHSLAYPSLEETPEKLWDAFSASSSNVLLLIGDVGTGKSSWTRELLDHRGWEKGNAYIVDSTTVLMAPCFSDFIRDLPQGSLLICEDNDLMTQKRTDGNVHMSALLNATSGLIATSMKLLISTNLTNTDEMDKGIIRPGRLFDTLIFRKLTGEEATVLHTELKPEAPHVFESAVSLAEVINYHESRGTRKSNKITGFRLS